MQYSQIVLYVESGLIFWESTKSHTENFLEGRKYYQPNVNGHTFM